MQRQRLFSTRFLVVSFVAAVVCRAATAPNARAQDADPPRAVVASLFQPVSLTCEGERLDAALERLSERGDFAYLIDRRVDPSTPVSGTFSNEPFVDALRKMLNDADLSFCVVDGAFVWVGPRDASGELLLLFALKREEDFATWPPKIAEKWSAPFDFAIADLAEPRDVFQALSKRLKTKFVGFDKTPFDRWRGVELRGVLAADLTSTLLFGFDVDYRYDESANAFKPIKLDKTREIKRLYPSAFARRLDAAAFPGCRFSDAVPTGETVEVVGTFADVARVEYAVSLLANKASRDAAPEPKSARTSRRGDGGKRSIAARGASSRKEVSGTIREKKLRDVFAYLEANLGTTFALDASFDDADAALDVRISCEFRNADEKKIAATIAEKIGATHRIDGGRVVFSKSKKR